MKQENPAGNQTKSIFFYYNTLRKNKKETPKKKSNKTNLEIFTLSKRTGCKGEESKQMWHNYVKRPFCARYITLFNTFHSLHFILKVNNKALKAVAFISILIFITATLNPGFHWSITLIAGLYPHLFNIDLTALFVLVLMSHWCFHISAQKQAELLLATAFGTSGQRFRSVIVGFLASNILKV